MSRGFGACAAGSAWRGRDGATGGEGRAPVAGSAACGAVPALRPIAVVVGGDRFGSDSAFRAARPVNRRRPAAGARDRPASAVGAWVSRIITTPRAVQRQRRGLALAEALSSICRRGEMGSVSFPAMAPPRHARPPVRPAPRPPAGTSFDARQQWVSSSRSCTTTADRRGRVERGHETERALGVATHEQIIRGRTAECDRPSQACRRTSASVIAPSRGRWPDRAATARRAPNRRRPAR